MKNKTLIIIAAILAVVAVVCVIIFFDNGPKDIGTGAKTITLEVIQKDGVSHVFNCHTDADNLEDLLLSTGFVEGEMAQYGLYIKTVEGVTADYDVDASYWALKKNGEDLQTGAKDTAIANGEHYELVYTK